MLLLKFRRLTNYWLFVLKYLKLSAFFHVIFYTRKTIQHLDPEDSNAFINNIEMVTLFNKT